MEILNSLTELLVSMGMDAGLANSLDHFIAFAILALVALLADFICRRVLLNVVARLVKKTKATWDDIVFDRRVMARLCHVVVPLVIYLFIPVAFADAAGATVELVQRVCLAFVILSLLSFTQAFLNAAYAVYNETGRYRDRPLKGLLQTVQVALWIVGAIAAIGVLTGRSPLALLAGLSAMSAVAMLVFKDSIMGFVSGIQLSANDMLKVGDWIKMPKYDVDGIVTEVTLNTVKVRNWDNSVSTVPPYALVSESFENWNAMSESGGRRIKRSINIDMNSVRFCTPEMLERYRKIGLLEDYMSRAEKELKARGAGNALRQTNLGVFRAYLAAYLRSLPAVNAGMHCMVRQLQPTQYGMPLELYFFSRVKEWAPYEGVQADIFDHVLAVVSEFDLKIFQLPSGDEVLRVLAMRNERPRAAGSDEPLPR